MYKSKFLELLKRACNQNTCSSPQSLNILSITSVNISTINSIDVENINKILKSIRQIIQIIYDWDYLIKNSTIYKNINLNLVAIFNPFIISDYFTCLLKDDLYKNDIKYSKIIQKLIKFTPPNAKGFYHIHFDNLKLIFIINDTIQKSVESLQIKYNLFDILSLNLYANCDCESINDKFINSLENFLKPNAIILTSIFSSIKCLNSLNKNFILNTYDNFNSEIDYYLYKYKPEKWKYNYYDEYYAKPKYKTAIIIGAGIAGANIAYRLDKLGIQTTIIDENEIASGASGNPIGILKPNASADDNINSQLSRSAVHYVHSFLMHNFQQQDWWKIDKIQEHFRHDTNKVLPINGWLDINNEAGILYWQKGICISPKLLIHNLLYKSQTINILNNTKINNINFDENANLWNIRTELAQKHKIIKADLLIICNSFNAPNLIQSIYNNNNNSYLNKIKLSKVHGQISGIPSKLFNSVNMPKYTMSGKGYIAKDLNTNNSNYIWAGATYEHTDNLMTEQQAHIHNLNLVTELIPSFIYNLDIKDYKHIFKHRKSTRAVCLNHLPIVGNIPHLKNAYIISGLSSHGLSWSHICADVIIANITNGIYPWSKTLHKACSST